MYLKGQEVTVRELEGVAIVCDEDKKRTFNRKVSPACLNTKRKVQPPLICRDDIFRSNIHPQGRV